MPDAVFHHLQYLLYCNFSEAVSEWQQCRALDIRSGGKKETCKIPPTLKEALPNTRITGGAAAKGGKKKKK